MICDKCYNRNTAFDCPINDIDSLFSGTCIGFRRIITEDIKRRFSVKLAKYENNGITVSEKLYDVLLKEAVDEYEMMNAINGMRAVMRRNETN